MISLAGTMREEAAVSPCRSSWDIHTLVILYIEAARCRHTYMCTYYADNNVLFSKDQGHGPEVRKDKG